MFDTGRFGNISGLNQLEKIEAELREQEENHPSEAAKEELVRVYSRMWELQPDKVQRAQYERKIAKLLCDLGWDSKRQQVNYEKARRFFEKLILLNKAFRVPIAHYRLGFIHYHNQQWDRAIWEYQKALDMFNSPKPELDEPWAKLSESDRIKAGVRLAMAYKKKSIEIVKQVRSLHENSTVKDDVTQRYIQELEAEIDSEVKPYYCISPEELRPINDREYRQFIEREDAVILDTTVYGRNCLYVGGISHPISDRNMDILWRLLSSPRAIPSRQLEQEIGIHQASVYINRLREFLRECGLEEEAIVTRDGYRWIRPNSYYICRSDDPNYLFLP